MRSIKSKIKEIDKLIENIKGQGEEPCGVLDGIVDYKKYSTDGQLRVMWILKEAYDISGNNGCGWDFRQIIKEKNNISDYHPNSRSMYRQMAYATYGLHNNYPKWEKIMSLKDNDIMAESLKAIAFINVKKTTGGTSTPGDVLKNAYNSYGDILLKQIECYNPQVIIGGNTLQLFEHDLQIAFKPTKYCVDIAETSDRIYINAYHPSLRKMPRDPEKPNIKNNQRYYEAIITATKKWQKKSNK